GLPGLSVEAIVPVDQVLWAATSGGIFRSIDRGHNWKKVDSLVVRKLVVDRARPDTIVAAHEGVFRSTDAGATWRRGPDIHYAISLAIDSRTGETYVGTSYDGVLKSTDGGAWVPARTGLDRLGEVIALAVDPRTEPSTLYATTSQLRFYRSVNGGSTWE